MSLRMLRAAAASVRLLYMATVSTPPSMVPSSAGGNRFAWEIFARGANVPGLTSVEMQGMSIWDWNAAQNQYAMTNFQRPANWQTNYASLGVSRFCFVGATSLLVVGGFAQVPTDTKAYRAAIGVAASPDPSVSFITPFTYAYDDPTVASISRASSTPFAYNGSVVFSFAADGSASTYPTANGYVEKVSASAAARNATALRTGLTADSTQNTVARAIAPLGGATTNGYAVVDVSDLTASTTLRYQLVNATGTPVATGTQLTFAGSAYTNASIDRQQSLLPLGATKVVAFDQNTPAGRLSLLTTNSASAPTTLTKGAEVALPPPVDFLPGLLDSAAVAFYTQASNNWFVDGKTLTWVVWKMTGGTSPAFYFSRLAVIESTSTSSITVTLVTTDIRGRVVPPYQGIPYNTAIVSAPGGKAVALVPSGPGDTSIDQLQRLEQYTFQL